MRWPKLWNEFSLMAHSYRSGAYPAFVYGEKGGADPLPVFFFHEPAPEVLRDQLRYLADNGYATLGADAAVEQLTGASRAGPPGVVLSFDDGPASLYHTVFPLLQEFQVRIVAYVVPAWIDRPGFLRWDECREMHASGWVDFQSHSFSHHREVASGVVEGFCEIERLRVPAYDLAGMTPELADRGLTWFPRLTGPSRFGAGEALDLPPELWDDWQEAEAKLPDAEPTTLGRAFREVWGRWMGTPRRLGREQRIAAMTRELEASREALESALPGHRVRHFAFPWHENGPLCWPALERAGFASAALGILPAEDGPTSAGGALPVTRVNGDFLVCLPGRGRRGFARVLAGKIRRRMAPRTPS